ncbi:DciA family protein [Bifidobacterium gallicum]|uniref:Zn-ribbon-containing, RNA-binding like protein n=1 Tax=Bifidobacterium gallicum DSM 20093 = LMG 11596 TaxID=561180 RepID=D1NWD2_9BIFI|nr:DUF721 domain-containing protein [Bifidobacterium gallicum]EFA22418.1 hypothetical protein BIFGAL_04181 [Bifidobacterium gallicum DSM 20093 = LMG 11596]KFI60108.1 Zn-ribbon-containing, RNA-binding like protein [Bifidobacterium gallicum DSM 20093 = LMG 11596]
MSEPIAVTLKLDQRKLPAQVFTRLSKRAGMLSDRRARNERAFEEFGQPGRDPNAFGGVMAQIAQRNGWLPYMKTAQLRMDWASVVGDLIAQHTWVQGFVDGVLYIGVESPAWATHLQYMMPDLYRVVPQRLQGLDITDIRISGNQQRTRKGKAHPKRFPGQHSNR